MTDARHTDGSRAPHLCVVGIQWGDEGKGKIVDVLSGQSDVVVRYQGGANAGHTVKIGDVEYVLHLIPSGILQGKLCVIGNGVVVDPKALVGELDRLRAKGLDHEANVVVSDRAHVVLPYHRELDAAKEGGSGGEKIGTTLRGIGPCYADKAARTGIRMAEFIDPARFAALLRRNLDLKNREFVTLHGRAPLDYSSILDEYTAYAERLAPRVRDVSSLLEERDRAGEVLLFEGAQGALLDIDLGTYPFVTSSTTSFLGLGPGTGFSPRRVGTVYGVTKAYTTRVGEGPFPTELDTEAADALRQAGGEFGATTGRPRRCGWLDLVALRRTVQVGDVDALVVTKLDVLDGLDSIDVAVAYEDAEGRRSTEFPLHLDDSLRPVYESLPGWTGSVRESRRWEDLPEGAKEYLRYIARGVGRPIAMVSVGKERSEVVRLDPWLAPGAH